jgi:tetratricopeptide (TPR) repeat protein
MLRLRRGRGEEALRLFEEARAIEEKLACDYPDDVEFKSNLGGTINNIGLTLMMLDRNRDALNAFQRAAMLQQSAYERFPENERYQRFLCNHYMNIARIQREMGHQSESSDAARMVHRLGLRANDPAQIYSACRSLALSAVLGLSKTKPTAEELAASRLCADRAIDALRDAIGAGFRDLEFIRNDPNLHALRKRVDFEELVAQAEGRRPVSDHGRP